MNFISYYHVLTSRSLMCAVVVIITVLAPLCVSSALLLQQQQQQQQHGRSSNSGTLLLFKSSSSTTLVSTSRLDAAARHQSSRQQQQQQQQQHSTTDNGSVVINKRIKPSVHLRNAFQGSYDMDKLCATYPDLTKFIQKSHSKKAFRPTIDFSDPDAVRALNAALLAHDYGIPHWQEHLPDSSLTPPVPGRADYIHYLADVLSSSSSRGRSNNNNNNDGGGIPIDDVPCGPEIRGLDIGTGASLIYPLLGTKIYDWSFIASDVDSDSIEAARHIIIASASSANALENSTIDIRLQQSRKHILKGILRMEEEIDFCMCNPPFYESEQAYQKENARKMRNLALNKESRNSKKSNSISPGVAATTTGSNNFAGGASELWYPGGEVAFISTLIQESRSFSTKCLWFSSLVSRRDSLPALVQTLENSAGAVLVKETRIVEMGQGQKSSSILFWTFHDRTAQKQWCRRRNWQFGKPS